MNLSTVYQNLKQDWRQEGENIAMKKVAIGLLQAGTGIDLILKVTGLTRQEIQQLRDRLATGETPDSIIQ